MAKIIAAVMATALLLWVNGQNAAATGGSIRARGGRNAPFSSPGSLTTTFVPPDSPSAYTANSDRATRTNYALTGSRDLSQPDRGAGYVFTDALYGSRLLRVTDGSSTSPNYNNRSFLNPSSAESAAWNADSTRFHVTDNGGGVYIFNFDAETFSVSRPGNTGNDVKGLHLIGVSETEPHWSYVNPDYLYSHYLYKIRRFDMGQVNASHNTPPFEEVVEVADIYNAVSGGGAISGSVGRLQTSATDPEIIIAPFGGTQDTWTYLLWYNLGTGEYKVLDTRRGTTGQKVRWYSSATGAWADTAYDGGWGIHNARLDKTGRYVIPTRTAENVPAGEGILELWDTDDNTLDNISNADKPGGHVVLGYGRMINFSEDNTGGDVPWDSSQWWFRSLDAPTAEARLVVPNLREGGDATFGGFSDDHPSWHNSRASSLKPVISAVYRWDGAPPGSASNPWRAWDGEVVAARTDGAESKVWRFCQHQSITWSVPGVRVKDFSDIPIPQVSQNGRFALFSSNWGDTLGTDSLQPGRKRKDVFIVELEPNDPPAVDAGSDQSLPSCASSGTLTAAATDPDGGTPAVLWTKVAGPNTPTIASPTSRTTNITGMIAGTYVFRCTATDDEGGTGFDEVQVVVAAAPAPTPTPPPSLPPTLVNLALASGGATAAASSTLDAGRAPLAAINGDRKGLHWGSDPATGSGWHDATNNAYPDWLEVSFPGPRTIHEVHVFSVQDNVSSPAAPTEAMTFTKYGVVTFQVERWTGSAWAAVPGGAVCGNDRVWRKLTFAAPFNTTKIRVVVSAAKAGYSRLAEVEAWGERVSHALASNGATAAASSTLDVGRAALAAINGDRRGLHWASDPATGSGWHDATQNNFPDWLEVTFAGPRTISEVYVFSVQDNHLSPAEPTDQMTFTKYGLADFDVQYWDGSAWATIGTVNANDLVWRKFVFAPLTTTKIRVYARRGLAGYSRITEVEAY